MSKLYVVRNGRDIVVGHLLKDSMEEATVAAIERFGIDEVVEVVEERDGILGRTAAVGGYTFVFKVKGGRVYKVWWGYEADPDIEDSRWGDPLVVENAIQVGKVLATMVI